ncbi:hypothetical protein C2S52_007336 [Perilla frutescens var. hirtella]|nr:hypothetical protein C2S52_007336 [Perilla frutescens var. hirtella]
MDPKMFISDWYHKIKYMATYEHAMEPILGRKFMLSCGAFEPLEAPHAVKMPGRPPKKRIRGSHESMKGNTLGKLSRKEVKLRCTICRSENHNRTKCPNKGSQDTCIEKVRAPGNKRRRTTGLGIYINEETGNMVLNPGFQSETLIRQSNVIASQTLSSHPDPNIKYPIPNDKELRRAQKTPKSSIAVGRLFLLEMEVNQLLLPISHSKHQG